MYQFIPRRSGTVRFFIACLITFTLFTTPLASLAASRKQVAFKASPLPSAPEKSSDPAAVNSSVSNVSAPAAMLVPTITASKVDALFTDVNGDTNVDPGDTLEYTVTIQNTGTDATGVTFTDTIDAHTTLVGGSVNTSPIAFDDPSYTATGNVQITIPAGSGVLVNDIDPDTGNNTGLTASAGATSANGGNVTMNANGSFTYNPAPGFEGTDTFTYTVTDPSGATGTGTVTFNVTGMIWFVNSALGANGDGRLSSPFNCLVGAGCYSASANGVGDNIFLYSSATTYTGGLVLKNNQRLIGGGASQSLSVITGLNPPSGSLALPATGGANPTVATAAAATDSITLAQGNTLRGFNIANSTDSDIAGSGFGTASITEMTLSGTGRALELINGTLSSSSLSSITVDTSPAQGILLQQVAGSLTIGGTTVTSSTTQGIHVTLSTADISFGNTSVGNATAAVEPTIGVSLVNNSAGTRTFGTLTILNVSANGLFHSTAGGATTVTGATTITNPTLTGVDIQDSTTAISFQAANITQSGGTGVFIDDSTGAISFTDLDINPDGGQRGLHITDHATGTITTTSGTITTTTGTGVEITGAGTTPLAMVLTQVTVNGAPSGVVIQNNSGTFSLIGDNTNARNGSGGTFTNTTSDGVRLSNGNNITLKSINMVSPGDTLQALIEDNEDDTGEHGVEAISGSNIILSGISIDAPAGSGVVARNLTGTSRINNNSLITNIDNPATHGLYVRNDSVNNTLFEVNDTDFTNSSSAAATLNATNSGTANMTVEVRNGCIFEALSSQAITMAGGALAGTTGTLTSLVTGNTFRNAAGVSENNVAALVSNSATHNATISTNLLENIAEDGTVANTSIIRTQNSGGKMTAVVSGNTIQNIAYGAGAGGRHVIGHVFEPISYSAANFSDIKFENNVATNITYTGTNRGFIYISYREQAAGGDIKILGNNWNMPTAAATDESLELEFRNLNAAQIDVQINGNTGVAATTDDFLLIDNEDVATANVTITNNSFTTTNSGSNQAIEVRTLDNAAAGDASTCVNISGNTLSPNSINLVEDTNTTMTSSQASAAAMTAANGGATVTAAGVTFGQPACTLPVNFLTIPNAGSLREAVASVSAERDYSSVVAKATGIRALEKVESAPVTSESKVTTAIRRHSHHAVSKIKRAYQAVTNLVTGSAPMMLAGETVSVVGSGSGFTLPANKTITIKFRVTVNNPPNLTLLNPARVSNQGTVEGTNFTDVLTDDPAVGGAADPTETLIDLFDSQTSVISSSPSIVQGSSVTFTATVTPVSAGPTPVTGTVDFFDGAAIPANLIAGCDDRPLSGDPAQATCTTTALTAAGSPHTITARYNADGGNYDASSGTVSQTVILVPDLTIDKQHTGTFFQGQTGATYTITVTNSGNGAMPTGQSISVTDTLPDGLIATAMSGTGWTCAPTAPPNTFPVSGPTTISCARSGDTLLAAAASYPNITLTVNVDSDAPTGNPALSNDVSVTQGAGGEVNTGNNSDTDPTAINAGVDLTIDKSHTDVFTQGDTGKTYTITVTNSGGTATSGTVTVADTLPTGLTPTAPNGAHNGWTCSIVGQDLTCTRSDVLNPAASYPNITLTVDVANNAPLSVDNTATVSGGGDINGANNSDTDQTTINQLCLTPPANMVAWWTGDDTTRDIVGGNDGTLQGNAGYAAGKVLNGFNLDGTGDYVQAPDSNSLDLTSAITMDAWVNPTNANANGSLVDKISVGGTDGYSLDLVNGNLRFKFGSQSAQSTGVIPNATFTHVAVTYDGANVVFYINGVLDSTTPLTGAIPVNALPLRIGAAQDGSSGFAGVIDEVEIFSTALPVADILAISNAGTQGKCKPSDLRITKTHSGNFYLNQTGATYTITVTNDGPGDTTGTVTVADTLPAGLTATGFSGTNWTCQPLPVLSCSRSDVLASGGVYENIILTVNVDSGAPTGPNAVTNTATVSGGGGLDTSDDTANDPTQINTLPDNIAPVNTVPGPQATDEDVALVFTGATQISIADADAGSNPVQVSLTATNGVISLSGTTGLNFACGGCSGDGTSDASMVFQGTITDINNALNNLTFTPALNYSGAASLQIVTDDLGNTGFGGSQSDTDTINITVNSVNDPPSFNIAGNPPAVDEDAGAQTVNGFATSISSGPGESQTLTFNLTPNGTTGNLAFSSGLSIDATTGNLTYTASPDTNGTATFDVTLSDNGGGTNTSGTQSFTITVNAVNDAPTFQIASNPPAVNEDAGPQTVNSFATNFQPGPVAATDEGSQTLVGYTVTQTGSTGSLTFSSAPAISNAGALTYTSSADTFGTATFDVVATDSGSGTAPNVNQSAAVSFTITVNAVNDPPSFTIAADPPAIAINSPAQTVNSFATNISQGPGETGQTLTFNLSPAGTTGTIAFTSGPSIDATTGDLTYTPQAGTSGTATFDVTLSDNGGGTDTSAVQQFTITITPQLDLIVNTLGDAADLALDGVCDTDAAAGDQCTLRAAIQETNNASSADTIAFSLPASSTIELASALPAIAGDLEINGPTNKLTIDGNSTGRVFEVTSGTVSIDPLTITGGLVNGGHGAGLLVTGGDVTLKDLLFTANTAINGNGGAVAITGGTLTILNTTISGNTATNAGGVYLGAGSLTMINVTVTNNTANGDTGSGPTATGDGGGLAVGANPSFIRNSIIAGNTATTNTNISGSIGLGGNNLVAGDPRLAPLADNGGPTMTHALLAGSPAIDAGDNNQATTAGLVNDQRGFDRITDGNGDTVDTVDIGAFEAQVFLEDIADRAIDEDGSDSFSFDVGGAAAITNVTATSSNTALVPNSVANLAVTGAGGTRTLTITPVVNGFGTTTITVTVESASGNMSDTFLFTVNPVNDPPVFTGGPNVVVNEDAGAQTIPSWATGISPGPANESTQTLTFLVSNNNNGLFSVQPAIATNGTLTFTPAANTSGVATVSVQLQDNGGGTDSFPIPPLQFTITVNAVNDPPTFTGGPNQTVNEDAGAQTVLNWATGISAGPADESGQTLTFLVSNGNNSLFSVQPAIATNGTLTYTPAANASGVATVSVQLQDNGGGTDTSPFPPYTFTITVNAVNDAPSFTKGPNQTVNEDAGAQSVSNWATAISAGPANESGQTVAFNVTNDNNALFSIQPAVSPTGTLTYTPAPNANGTATVSVSLTDNGGTANGGQNTSAVQTFTITVNAVNDGPVNTVPGAQSVTENGTLTFSAGNGNQISIADVDAGAPGVQVTLSATNGTITLAGTAGLAFSNGDGTADGNMTFTGTVASINTALNGLVFTPTSGFAGAASLQIVTNDLGNTGSGGGLSDTDIVNITVNDGGALQFSSATYSVNENGGTATITVNRTGGTAGTTTVDFTTSNGTATAGVSDDYLTSSGTLTFGPGVTSQTFTVTINEDPNNEPNETINLTLSNVTGSGSLGTPSTAVLTIVDNDPGGALQFSSATYSVSESGGSVIITVVRVGGSTGTAFVDFATSNGTATAGVGQDYTATSGTLTFGNGVTSQTFTIPILPDPDDEPDETVNLTLSNVSGTGNLGSPSTAVLTILDNDPPTFSLDASSYTVDEDDLRVTVTVNRGGDLSQAVTVDYATSDPSGLNECSQVTGNASQRCDYATVVGTLRFAAGEATKVIHIPVVDDVYIEGAETFTLTLSDASGGTLGTPATATVTINDNDVG
ncbi:MAG TPA: Calx-beta domain-containing protein, partial [Pyrinomonadaceae bacterium]|nr:Calx-beta domain-containing protein [Pyrinomonadaceae bacterium]